MLWTDIATHYHSPTGQLAGPHSRAYGQYLAPDVTAIISRGLPDGKVSDPGLRELFYAVNAVHAPAPCPEKLHRYFDPIRKPRVREQVFTRGNCPVSGCTLLDPAYTIGSINHSIMWDQRRNVIGYWISGNPARPHSLHLRLLRDGYDFSSGYLVAAQSKGSVLAGIGLVTDGGDRHCCLDLLKDGTIETEDLRARLHLYDVPASLEPPKCSFGEPIELEYGSAALRVRVEKAAFGDSAPTLEFTRQGADAYLDVVLYHGPRRKFDLREVESAHVLMTISMRSKGTAAPKDSPAEFREIGDRLNAEWSPGGGRPLSIGLNRRPLPQRTVREIACASHKHDQPR